MKYGGPISARALFCSQATSNMLHLLCFTLSILSQIEALSLHRPTLRMFSLEQLPSTFLSIPSSLPLCITPTFPTTTVDDPTAGMSPEEITNYVSNVGGGLCGNSDAVKIFIGLSLNISLLVFGFFTISYIAAYGTKFFMEKQVEDGVKSMEKRIKLAGGMVGGGDSFGSGEDFRLRDGAAQAPGGLSRADRRMKQKLKDNTKKP